MRESTTRPSPTRQAVGLAAFLGGVFLAAGLGSVFTATSVNTWYPALAKPPWTPPAWVFGPVWIVLYATMALAAWLVWRRGLDAGRRALRWFAVQLALNVLWSAIFFGGRMPGLAIVDIVALWLAIIVTGITFWRISRAAGWLLVPYLFWVSFAAILNIAIWRLNA